MPQLSMHSPLADLTLTEVDGLIVSVDWGWAAVQDPTPLLLEAKRQLDAYFDGDKTSFDLPLSPNGSCHQQRVQAALANIPYGSTKTYGQIAAAIGSSPRAIGMACGRNPIPIIIPCHRVVAAGGLGGYSGDGGSWTKRGLLVLEGNLAPE